MKKRDIRKEELQRYWHAHVVACRESGLSCQGYARRHGLYKNAIRYWGRKFPADASPAVATGARSITLQTKIAPAPSGAQRSEVKFVPVDFSSKDPEKPDEPLVLRVGRRFRIDVVRVHAIFHPWGHEKSTPSKRLEECMNILDFLGPRVPLLPPPQPVVEDVMITGDIFKTIHFLKKSGFGVKSIARRLDLDPGTVRKYLNQSEVQPYSRDCLAKNSLTGLEEWLRARSPEVMFNGKVLFREAREKGFTGSYSIIKRFLKPIREQERVATEATVRFETPPGLQGQVDWGSSKVPRYFTWVGQNLAFQQSGMPLQ